MFVKVDDNSDLVEGFEYTNRNGFFERVVMHESFVTITDDSGAALSDFYIEDIPKLINALQAAYDYQTKKSKSYF